MGFSKFISKTLWIIEDFTARTPILGWCLGLLLTSLGATDDAKAAIAKCNNSTISYIVGAIFISLSEGFEGIMFALLFATAAGATGGIFGHYGEATTADRMLTPNKETREKLASYLVRDVGVSVMIGVTAGNIIEIVNAALPQSLSATAANFAAVELCAALSVFYSLPADEDEDEEEEGKDDGSVIKDDGSVIKDDENDNVIDEDAGKASIEEDKKDR